MEKEQASDTEKQSSKEEVFEYKAAGIQETHGHVPAWLWMVVVVMSIWGVAYLYIYWSPSP